MTAAEIDWTAVERRARAREPVGVLTIIAFFIGWAASTDHFVGTAGSVKWLLVSGYVLLLVCLLTASRLHPRTRARAADGYRMQYALRAHVDPGPTLRERVDRQAAYMDRIVWFRWWLVFFIPLGLLVSARWDRPLVTVPAVLVVEAVTVSAAVYLRRLYGAAERWVADPPGPPREMPQLGRWQRWASGWAFVWALLGVLAVGIALGVLLVGTR